MGKDNTILDFGERIPDINLLVINVLILSEYVKPKLN